MIRVVIIDDAPMFLTQLQEKVRLILERAKIPCLIECLESANQLTASIIADADIFLLDMDFQNQEYTGVDIARSIRRYNQYACLIFITNYIEYAPEGYEVQAFRYLLKSELEKKLEHSLLQAVHKLQNVHEVVSFQIGRDTLNLPTAEILYVESLGHAAFIHVNGTNRDRGNIHKVYSSLSALEEKLVPFGFLRVHKSFLVNMRRIKKYQYNEVVLDNGTSLQVSQKDYAENKKQYLLWKGKQ